MTVHPAFVAGSFAHLKLGALPAKKDPRTLQLARYLDDAVVLPTVPKSFGYVKKVPSWPMYGNDRLGDCTLAAAGHMIQAWTAAAGKPVTPTEAAVEAAYFATGDHQDTGRYEIEVLNWWRHQGIGGDKIAAYVSVEPSNLAHVRAAIYLFGGVYTGIALPISAQTQSRWTVTSGPNAAAGSWGGHAVPFEGYTSTTLTCVTWGHPLVLTNGFHKRYTDEVYAVVSTDFLDAVGRSPAGFNIAALQADLASL